MTGRTCSWGRSPRGPSPARVVTTGLTLVLLGTSAIALAAPSAPQYGARPSHAAHAGEPAADFVHALEPGAGISDAVEVFNFTDAPAQFHVYATDLVPTAGGDAMTPAAREAEVVGAGTWLSPARETVSVGPRSSVEVPFDLVVPAGTPPEHHAAALVVEPETGTETAAGPTTVTNRTRIALRVDVDVLGEIDLGVILGGLTWERTDGGVRFTLPVTNDGTVTFEASGRVDVRGSETTLPLGPNGLYPSPGETVELTATWDDPPVFGHVTVRPVVEAVVGTRAPRPFAGAEVSFWLVPWRLVASLAVAILLVVGIGWSTHDRLWRWWHRRRDERARVRDFRRQLRSGRDADAHRPPVGVP